MKKQLYNKHWSSTSYLYRKKVNNKCEVCGKPGTKDKPLHVHHIDGNKRNDMFANLQALCSRCHFKKSVELNQIDTMTFQYIRFNKFKRRLA